MARKLFIYTFAKILKTQNSINMKKVILSLAVICITTLSASAQKGFNFSVAANLGIPVGDLSPYASFAYGGDVQGEYMTSSTFSLTLNAGYIGFSAKSGYSISGGLVPVLGGFRYYFSPKVYGTGQIGISFATSSGGGSAVTYSPGVGFKLGSNFDILAKYQSASKNGSDNSFVGVRAAYIFPSGK